MEMPGMEMPGMEPMAVPDHIAAIRREGDLITAALRGSPSDRLDAVVPSRPEWSLRELVHHLGRTHHWATAHVEQSRATPLSEAEQEQAWGPMPADRDLADWYAAANARLVAALDHAPADLTCWAFPARGVAAGVLGSAPGP